MTLRHPFGGVWNGLASGRALGSTEGSVVMDDGGGGVGAVGAKKLISAKKFSKCAFSRSAYH